MGTLFHPSKRSEITGLIRSRLAQSGRDTGGVEIMNYTYEAVHGIEDDEYMLSMWRRMLILSLGLSLFSGLIIQSAYRNHIAAFSPELMELASLGATKGPGYPNVPGGAGRPVPAGRRMRGRHLLWGDADAVQAVF